MTPLAEALAPKSDQLNADDLIPGPRTIKITDARIVVSERQKKITLNFEGDNGKPFKPCKTMGRAMVLVWGVTDEKQMIGKSITIYRDPDVKFGDQGAVGGIRISHMSHIDQPKTVKLTVSQGKKGTFVFQPLTAEVRTMNGNGKQRQRDDAADWAATLRADLDNAPDVAELDAIMADRAQGVDRLKRERPELHTEVEGSYAARRASIEREGKPSGDYGGGFDDDETPAWQATVDALMRQIAEATDADALDAATEAYRPHALSLPREVAANIEAALRRTQGEL